MKLRRIDLYHEEFLAAVVGEMTPAELGVYWMICLLQYNRGGELLKYDMPWLRAKFRPGHGNRWVEDAVKRLIESGRLVVEGSLFGCSRVVVETLRARCRVVEASLNGHRGGRPRKDINGIEKGSGFSDEKLTTTTTTTTTIDSESEADASAPGAAPPQTPPVDPVKVLWDSAVGLLESAHVKNPRPLIGKWRREYGDVAVMAAVNQAANDAVAEPVAFIVATLSRTGANGHARRQSPVEKLYEGAYRAVQAREARRRANLEPDEPLLDRGRPTGYQASAD